MVIDIKSPGSGPSGARGTGRGSATENRASVPGATTAETSEGGGSSGVHLSDEAQAMRRLANELRGGDSVDHAKVASIRDALASNTYRIDPQKIADKLIQFEIDTGK